MKRVLRCCLGIVLGVLFCGMTAFADEFTVAETSLVLYSNSETALYQSATEDSVVVISKEDFPDGAAIQVTGITSTGFFQVELNGTYYVPAAGLSADASATTAVEDTSTTVTLGMSNALTMAKKYLKIYNFSYSELVEQLEYEGFSTAEATYAVDNCGANWYEEAATKAQKYLKLFSLSRSKLITQLEHDGFTTDQAEYAATAAGY